MRRLALLLLGTLAVAACDDGAVSSDAGETDAGRTHVAGEAPIDRPGDGGEAVEPDTGASAEPVDGGGAHPPASSCAAAEDCPPPSTLDPCEQLACTGGACGVQPVAAGTHVGEQTPGDCRVLVCDRHGELASDDDDDDQPEDDGNQCSAESCNAGSARHLPEPAGTACDQGDGKVCDGHGACVECVLPGQCSSDVCQDGLCRPALCANGTLDSGEADVDCGGDCGGCAPDQACAVDDDCAGMECSLDACVPNCADHVQNHGESDADCGASCPEQLCENGLDCTTDDDCESGFCTPTGGECATPSCDDGFENGSETDVDCGGSAGGVTCPSCPVPCTDNWECDGVVGAGKGICYDHLCTDSVNGCTLANATDMTGMVATSLSAPLVIEFGGGSGDAYSPRCLKVTMGSQVRLDGPFAAYPLVGGVVEGGVAVAATSGPFLVATDSGSSKLVTMDDCGGYPYYSASQALSGMTGAVIVMTP